MDENILKLAVKTVPSVTWYLNDAALWKLHEIKSFEYFRRTLGKLVKSLFEGNIGGEFKNILGSLVNGQIIDATVKAWADEGGDGDPPKYLKDAAQKMVEDQKSFIDGYYKDIIDAKINNTSIEPLMVRSEMWANRYNEAYNNAVTAITAESGGKLIWYYDATKEHCLTCEQLHLTVAFASEWERSGLKPQNAPNDLLECGGWQCGCRLEKTDKKRSPNAMDKLLTIGLGM